MMLTNSPSATIEIDRVDGGEAAEAARQAAQGQQRCMRPPSYRAQQALRPEADEQQQHDAVDQHAVLRRDPEHLRQADQRHRADDGAD